MPRVDRSHSQFEEIRNYHDRSMIVANLFLSEHTTAMKEDKADKVYYEHHVKGALR